LARRPRYEVEVRPAGWLTFVYRKLRGIEEPALTAEEAFEAARRAWQDRALPWNGPFMVEEHARVYLVLTEHSGRDCTNVIEVDARSGEVLRGHDGWGIRRI